MPRKQSEADEAQNGIMFRWMDIKPPPRISIMNNRAKSSMTPRGAENGMSSKRSMPNIFGTPTLASAKLSGAHTSPTNVRAFLVLIAFLPLEMNSRAC